ncbi:MAG: hypothetical protein WC501_05600 [Candidatus Micrarchaeia archaeon]|jgi:Arc/MetJ-type ribon-helix-helix transcriptional regulator
MNINLGAPYERILKKVIDKGYAGNQTEVVRQALLVLDRQIDEEEVKLVNKGINYEMSRIKKEKVKTYSEKEIREKYRL